MSIPGTIITDQDLVSSGGVASAIDTCFIAGVADLGPATPLLALNYPQYVAQRGDRTATTAVIHDSVKAMFDEGLARLYHTRALGPAAAAATITVPSSSPQGSFTAKNKGAEANGGTITITSGVVTVAIGGVTETSPTLATVGDLINWVTSTSRLVSYTATAGTGVALSNSTARTLAGGADDRASLDAAAYLTALNTFTADYGPGVGYLPGVETAALAVPLDTWAGATPNGGPNRTYKVNLPDSADHSARLTFLAAMRALPNADKGKAVIGHGVVAGGTVLVPRTVPLAGQEIAIEARNDAAGIVPNQPAAGKFGISRVVSQITTTRPTDAQWQELLDAGGNIWITVQGDPRPRAYGQRTAADVTLDPIAAFYGSARLRMLLDWRLDAVAESYVHVLLSSDGVTQKRAEADAAGELKVFSPQAIGNYEITSDVTAVTSGQVKLTLNAAYEDTFAAEVVQVNVTRTITLQGA